MIGAENSGESSCGLSTTVGILREKRHTFRHKHRMPNHLPYLPEFYVYFTIAAPLSSLLTLRRNYHMTIITSL